METPATPATRKTFQGVTGTPRILLLVAFVASTYDMICEILDQAAIGAIFLSLVTALSSIAVWCLLRDKSM